MSKAATAAPEFRRPNKSARRPLPQATDTVRFTYNKMESISKFGFNPVPGWEKQGWVQNKDLSSKDGTKIVMEISPEGFNKLTEAVDAKTRRRAGSTQRPEGMNMGSIRVEVKREKVSGAKMRRELEANQAAA